MTVPPFTPAQVQDLVERVLTGPDRILPFPGGRFLLIDGCDNPANAADLALVECAPGARPDEALAATLAVARRLAAQRGRRAIETTTFAGSPLPERSLRAAGFAPVYDTLEMARAVGEVPAPDSDFRAVDRSTAPLYYDLTRAAFAANAETSIPERSVFLERATLAHPRPRLLWREGRAVGLVKVALPDEIVTIGVDPGARGSGLGKRCLREAIRLLAENGATSIRLQVRGDNVPARTLYDRAGFRTERRYSTFSVGV